MSASEQVRTSIAYDGPDLRSGLMDVRDLAPAMLALGQLVQDANRVLNGDRAQVVVRVESGFERGSFQLKLWLLQTLPQQAASLFSGRPLTDIATLAKLLGLSAFPEGVQSQIDNIMDFIKWLAGREPKSVEPVNDESVRVENNQGAISIVNNGTLILYNDNSVRTDITKVVRPLANPGIDTFEVRAKIKGRASKTISRVSKQELRYFSPAEPDLLPAVAETTLPEVETPKLVGLFKVVAPTFKEANKWRLNAGQGDIWVSIADQSFLASVHSHKILFGEGDILRAEYVTRVWRKGSELVGETTIIKVIEKIEPAPNDIQQPLL
jgi:hypothetical protein